MSWQLRLMETALRRSMRALARGAQDPVQVRKGMETAARLFFHPGPIALCVPDSYPGAQSLPALWVQSGQPAARKVLLYLHGGGYLAGSPQTHRRMVARLCRKAGIRAFLPAYRLAPEHKLPAALEDAEAAFFYLTGLGYRPEDISIGGDSAGGGLALSLLARLCEKDMAPAAVFAWSPFTDQTFSGASLAENAATDHFFPARRVHDLGPLILGDCTAQDPRVSPLFARFKAPPPVLLQASECEILRDDSVRMAAHLRAAGGTVELQLWPDTPHVWHIFDGWMPEAREAINATAEFLRRYS